MNNIDTGIEEVSQVQKSKTPSFTLNKITDKIPPKVKEVFARFYSNKKIFWPISITFGVLFLVIILGLLFGTRGTPLPPLKKPTPSPFVAATPAPCPVSDTLCLTGNKLNDLENQINSLDLNQSRLTPPQINYDISF